MGREPRVIVVTRPSEYQELLERHGTREQARFFLESRHRSFAEAEARHAKLEAAMAAVSRAIPVKWRRSFVARGDLSRFVFEPDDLIVAVGQDGLVANVAKYLRGQPVLGVNPDASAYDGVLVRHAPESVADLLGATPRGLTRVVSRTMVEALQDDQQRILALNEVFIGHRSHQSARYRVHVHEREERQSSSGLIVSTGTGATGWARSISGQLRTEVRLPAPTERKLSFFVREPFPSVATGTSITVGLLESSEAIEIVSEMNEGGVIFGDGIEDDRIEFEWGKTVQVRIAEERLQLVER